MPINFGIITFQRGSPNQASKIIYISIIIYLYLKYLTCLFLQHPFKQRHIKGFSDFKRPLFPKKQRVKLFKFWVCRVKKGQLQSSVPGKSLPFFPGMVNLSKLYLGSLKSMKSKRVEKTKSVFYPLNLFDKSTDSTPQFFNTFVGSWIFYTNLSVFSIYFFNFPSTFLCFFLQIKSVICYK